MLNFSFPSILKSKTSLLFNTWILILDSSWEPEHSYSHQYIAASRQEAFLKIRGDTVTGSQSFFFFSFTSNPCDCEMLSSYSNSVFVHKNIVNTINVINSQRLLPHVVLNCRTGKNEEFKLQ